MRRAANPHLLWDSFGTSQSIAVGRSGPGGYLPSLAAARGLLGPIFRT